MHFVCVVYVCTICVLCVVVGVREMEGQQQDTGLTVGVTAR